MEQVKFFLLPQDNINKIMRNQRQTTQLEKDDHVQILQQILNIMRELQQHNA